jgi:hypothetical protein
MAHTLAHSLANNIDYNPGLLNLDNFNGNPGSQGTDNYVSLLVSIRRCESKLFRLTEVA